MGGRKKTSESKVTDREYIYCNGCDKDVSVKNFYKSNGTTESGYIPYCKDCCYKYSLDNNGKFNIEKFKEMLQKIDKPFLYDMWDKCEQKFLEGKLRTYKSTIGNYIKNIAMWQYRDLKYRHSIFEPVKKEKDEEKVSKNKLISKDLIDKWGKDYDENQIYKLEKFYKDMINSYDVKTASHKDYLKKICKVSLKMDEALDSDSVTEFSKLSTVYDNLMKSAKFTAVQRSAVDDTGGFATFSEFIEALEKEGFIEPAKIEENYDIVEATIADIKNYTKKLVLGDSSINSMAVEQLAKNKEKENAKNE